MKKYTLLSSLILAALTIFLWFPMRYLPYWWDSAGRIIFGAHQFLQHHFLLLDIGLPKGYAHPPLLSFLLALIWKFFGESLLISHIVDLIFTLLAIFYTYLLGKFVYLHNNKSENKTILLPHLIGVAAALTLLFTPVFYAQMGIIYVEIPMTAFALMTIYYYLKNNLMLYLIFGTLMLYMKETGLFVIGAVLVIEGLKNGMTTLNTGKKIDVVRSIKRLLVISLPLLFTFAWFIYHRVTKGFFFSPPDVPWAGPKIFSLDYVTLVGSFFLSSQGRILVTLGIVILFFESFVREAVHKYVFRWNILLFVLIIFFTIIFFGLTEFLHRYIIVGLPFFYILFFYLVGVFMERSPINKQLWTLGGIVAVLIVISFTQWNLHRKIDTWYFVPLEDNLEYKDVIDIGKVMAKYIEKNFPHAYVYTSFPANYMLSQPYDHYVTKPITVKDCQNVKPGDKISMVVFHPFSPGSQSCLQMIRTLHFKPYRNFSKNGKFMAIYK